MSTYLERVTECKHDLEYPHWAIRVEVTGESPYTTHEFSYTCRDGSRVRVEPDYEAAGKRLLRFLYEIPANEIDEDWLLDMDDVARNGWRVWAKAIVDVALGDTK